MILWSLLNTDASAGADGDISMVERFKFPKVGDELVRNVNLIIAGRQINWAIARPLRSAVSSPVTNVSTFHFRVERYIMSNREGIVSKAFLAVSSADQRQQLHRQTLELHARALNISREYWGGLPLPIKRSSIVAANDLLELSDQLPRQREVLADFAAVFEEDFKRYSSVVKVRSSFEEMNSKSFHEEAIADVGFFLKYWLSSDKDAAKQLAAAATAAGVSLDAHRPVHLCDLLEDPQMEREIEGDLGPKYSKLVTYEGFKLIEKFPHMLWDGVAQIRKIEHELEQEFARSLELFAAERSVRPTAVFSPMEVFLTIKEIAALADVDEQTVYNRMTESKKRGAAPRAAEPGSGRRPNKYRYSEILPWLRDTWPAKTFPNSVDEAVAIIAHKAAKKSV